MEDLSFGNIMKMTHADHEAELAALRAEATRLRGELARVEAERAEQWRLRRDAEGSRDAAYAANASLRDELAAIRALEPRHD